MLIFNSNNPIYPSSVSVVFYNSREKIKIKNITQQVHYKVCIFQKGALFPKLRLSVLIKACIPEKNIKVRIIFHWGGGMFFIQCPEFAAAWNAIFLDICAFWGSSFERFSRALWHQAAI